MSDPADRNFEDPEYKHLEYAPRSMRPAKQQGSPGAAEGEYPRSVRYANQQGSPGAENELFDLVVPDLQRLAHYLMQRERKGHSLQPTELVDQIYFRLVAAKNQDWQNRRHFFAIAARAMRRYLIDHARGRPDVPSRRTATA